MSLSLEELVAHRNGTTFWKEFTFTQLKFRVPAGELELADNIVWFGETAFIIQMKEREGATDDAETERRWFDRKVVRAASKQIKDSLRFLEEQGSIPVSNVRGQELQISKAAIADIRKLVIYKPGIVLPDECRMTQFHLSQTAGFIHIIDMENYGKILEILVAPEEIRRYLEYRETSLRALTHLRVTVTEDDLLGAYATEEKVPTPKSHLALRKLVLDAQHLNLSSILSNLADHIENPDFSNDYSKILIEFAKLPRSAWRAAKERFDLAVRDASTREFARPYRFYFPMSDCNFVFAAIHPDIDHIANPDQRIGYLRLLTETGKYLARARTGVGIQIARDGKDVLVDWCLQHDPWEIDEQMERIAAESPFRNVRDQLIDGFQFS